MGAAAAVAAIAAGFGIAHDYSYLRASILTGSEKGQYYALANRLADRARRERGTLDVIATAGSIENVSRLTTGGRRCADMFALIQDGTPVPAEARLELLGRLSPTGVAAAAWQTRSPISQVFRLARGIHRDRPGWVRHGVSHAPAVRGC
jgi:hypothetical protein